MRTTDLAKAVGLSTQAVRGYELQGCLPPVERTEHGYRLFTERHLAALKTVRALRQAGYSIGTVQTIMQAVHTRDLETALALMDERHAELHRERGRIATAIEAIRILMECESELSSMPRYRTPLRISAAAKVVGVRPSALRFWEDQGLLQPKRAQGSTYRLYDQRQMHKLEIIAVLRNADYDFDTIRLILEEVAEERPQAAMRTVDQRRADITQASKRCAAASTALWEYMSPEVYDALRVCSKQT